MHINGEGGKQAGRGSSQCCYRKSST